MVWAEAGPGSALHDAANPGLALGTLLGRAVPDQYRLVSVAAVPGGLAPGQVGGGRSGSELQLLLLPDQQRRVPVPEPAKRFRQGLCRQSGPGRGTGRTRFLYSGLTVRHAEPWTAMKDTDCSGAQWLGSDPSAT